MKGTRYNLKQMKMDTVSPATRLLVLFIQDKRRLMYQVQDAYQRQKEQENRRLEIFNNKQQELRARDLAVQQKFVQFSKVINQNDAKLQRAKNRIEQQKRAIQSKQKKKQQLQQKLADLHQKSKELQQEVQNMKIYQDYLQSVRIHNPQEFADINDIRNLHLKLNNANSQLKLRQKELESQKNVLKTLKDQTEKKKKDEMLQLTIEIAQLSKLYEDLDTKRHDLTKQLEVRSASSTEEQVQIGKIFMTIDNLYSRCTTNAKIHHHKNKVPLPANKVDDLNARKQDAIEKLNIIKHFMDDFQKVIEDCPKQSLQKSHTARVQLKNLAREAQEFFQ